MFNALPVPRPLARVVHLHRIGLIVAMLMSMSGATSAQAWPGGAKPVSLVVGNVAGGGTDVIARIVAECL